MIKIAITGKIATGKSTISKIIKDMHYKVFEADLIVKELIKENEIKKRVINVFSKEVSCLILPNGEINLDLLGKHVFSNAKSLVNLENILHPRIKRKERSFIEKYKNEKFLFFDIPLLFEKGIYTDYKYIIYTKVDFKIQKERALKRKNMNEEKFLNILDKQNHEISKYKKYVSLIIDTKKNINKIKIEMNKFLDKI